MRLPLARRRFRRILAGGALGGLGLQGDALRQVNLPERGYGECFRLYADNARDLVYRYRFLPKRGFEYISPSSTMMTGYTPGEHYADPDLGLKRVHPEDRHLLERSMRSPEEPLVLCWYRKDGGLIWTEQRNRPIYDETGSLIARDVTERKLAEEALRLNEEQSETTRGPEGQRVTLESASSSGELRIDVGDQGPGIPETELPHVFDRFYRLATVEKPGSGLSIAQTVAEAHGGRIEAESQPGVGTRMSFILPLLQEESNVS